MASERIVLSILSTESEKFKGLDLLIVEQQQLMEPFSNIKIDLCKEQVGELVGNTLTFSKWMNPEIGFSAGVLAIYVFSARFTKFLKLFIQPTLLKNEREKWQM